MQTRYKIFILLFIATLAVGALTLLYSSNDNDAVFRFRSLFSNRTLYTFSHTLSSVTDGTSFWYGGISLFAIIMIVLVFRTAHRGGSQRFRGRLIELKPTKVPAAKLRPSEIVSAKAEGESLLREELKRITDLLKAKDSTLTELENGLAGKQQLLQKRSEELDAFKSRVDSLTEQLADLRIAKERAENILEQELKKLKFLQAKDSVITELEKSLTASQELLQSRSEELDALKSKVNTLTEQLTDLSLAKERTENILQKELKKTKVLQAKDSSIIEQENSLSVTVRALESELSEKQELLQTRSRELKAAKSKVNTLRERLTAIGSAKKQTENVLQQQLKQKTELLQSKDAAMKELQESLRAKIQALEGRLEEKEKLLKVRDAELEPLGSEANSPTESGPARKRAKSLLLQELQNRTELLQAKEIIVKELEERLNATVHALENARSEVERPVNQHEAELPGRLPKKDGPAKERAEGLLQSDRKGMNSKLLELGAAKARAASLQVEEAKERVGANDPAVEAPGKIFSRLQAQSVFPADKDEVLETGAGQSDALNTGTGKKERN
jgi:DNA repair exonuclease SbcCD ATPase subunit